MYIKNRKNNDSLLQVSSLPFDRDSGIMTETESDVDNNKMLFSDDEDATASAAMNPRPFISTVFNSTTHYASAADIAVNSLRQLIKNSSWKKVLKHKSGTTVYMASQNKMAYFKGEAIIEGFSPQSIFYVIGMRKLWDDQFEEGKLIENLNDTTSLTYESYKSSATSKAYDMTLVEKIDCSVSGEILFACTSVDTPNAPKVPGKNRHIVKLQGWILKPLNTSPISTKVTYLTQESIKGWIPGLTKKSLARKPLIISSVDNYLKSKAVRTKLQIQQKRENQGQLHSLSNTNSTISFSTDNSNSIPSRQHSSLTNNPQLPQYNSNNQQQQQQQKKSNLLPSSFSQATPSIPINTNTNTITSNNNRHDILIESNTNNNGNNNNNHNHNNSNNNSIDVKKSALINSPPPRHSSLSTGSRSSSATVKHISFADDVISPRLSSSTYSSSSLSRSNSPALTNSSSISSGTGSIRGNTNNYNDLNTITEEESTTASPERSDISSFPIPPVITVTKPQRLYASSRHRATRQECVNKLKEYVTSDLAEWKETGTFNKSKIYTKHLDGYELPVLRSEATIMGSWTPEQICSVIQCFGARKIWDEYFEDGTIIDRFSQKEYLVHTQMKSIFPIQARDFSLINTIDIDASNGTIYICSTSVQDELIPPSSNRKIIRGKLLVSGWALEPLWSKQKKGNKFIGVKTIFIHHMDMQGSIPLPPAIVRQLSQEIPKCLDRIQSYLRQNGCPPYIRRVTGKVIFEDFDTQHKIYTMEYIVKHRNSSRGGTVGSMWCTDIRIHQSTFSFGYIIETTKEEGIRVEIMNRTTIRIFAERDELDGRTVQIQIRENPSGKQDILWNENVVVRALSTELEKERPIGTDKKISEIVNDKNNNDIIEQELVQKKTKTDKIKPTTIKKQGEIIVEKEKEKVEEVEEEVAEKREKGIHHKYHNNDDYYDKKTRLIERSAATLPVIIITDELSFTAQQCSFILLLMMFCYYLGKFSCKCE